MANKSKALKSLEDQLKSSASNLKAGTAVLAKWRDGEEREAFVLERRLISTDAPITTTTATTDDGEPGMHQIRDVSAYRYYCAWGVGAQREGPLKNKHCPNCAPP